MIYIHVHVYVHVYADVIHNIHVYIYITGHLKVRMRDGLEKLSV